MNWLALISFLIANGPAIMAMIQKIIELFNHRTAAEHAATGVALSAARSDEIFREVLAECLAKLSA